MVILTKYYVTLRDFRAVFCSGYVNNDLNIILKITRARLSEKFKILTFSSSVVLYERLAGGVKRQL